MGIDLEAWRALDELGQRLVWNSQQFRCEVRQGLLVLGIKPLSLREARRILGDTGVLITLESGIDIQVGDDGLDGLDAFNGLQQDRSAFTQFAPMCRQRGQCFEESLPIRFPCGRVGIHIGEIPFELRINVCALRHGFGIDPRGSQKE